ncbi:MAG: glycosyltransferase family 2 protein [Candidatus Altiarchaeota archaeon]|nr:glycosyltransferase family 2 protein [Candidatus Altiarchaeota archaeon]
MTDISIVIPVYNEEGNIKRLYSELRQVLDPLKRPCEIIFIDDGSSDKTFPIIKELHASDKNVKAVSFRRNFGKSAALSAGFEKASGDIVYTLDGDLQDDPKEIPRFLDKLEEGFDLVVGWKYRRRDPQTKKLPSKVFNKLTSSLTGVRIHDMNCCFKAYRKEVVKNLSLYGELHRYIPALVHWKGYRVAEIKVNHRPRTHGRSKYGPMRLLKGFLDLITVKFLISYSTRPLHLFGIMGLLSALAGSALSAYLLYLKYVQAQLIGDRPLLFAAILLIIVGVQFISMGLLGEMITSTHHVPGAGYMVREEINS